MGVQLCCCLWVVGVGVIGVVGTDVIFRYALKCCIYCQTYKCCRKGIGHLCVHCFTLDLSLAEVAGVEAKTLNEVVVY